MALIIGDNFSYQGAKYLDSRKEFSSIEEMKNYPSTSLPKVFYAFVGTTEYRYSIDNEVDETLGRWRVWEPDKTGGSSGGGGTTVVEAKDEVQDGGTEPTEDNIKIWIDKNEDSSIQPTIESAILSEFTALVKSMNAKITALQQKVDYLEYVINNGGIVVPPVDPDDPDEPEGPVESGTIMTLEDGTQLTLEDGTLITFEGNTTTDGNIYVTLEDGTKLTFEDGSLLTFEGSNPDTGETSDMVLTFEDKSQMTFEDGNLMKFED